jgi:hypothetical protein
MAATVQEAIMVTYSPHTDQWIACFDGQPRPAFDGAMPLVAIRRLLDGTEAYPDAYSVISDCDLSVAGVLSRSIIWNPPELLFQCADCHGHGEYVGMLEREVCQTCGGRKLVSV